MVSVWILCFLDGDDDGVDAEHAGFHAVFDGVAVAGLCLPTVAVDLHATIAVGLDRFGAASDAPDEGVHIAYAAVLAFVKPA